jgi:hypothetical protein
MEIMKDNIKCTLLLFVTIAVLMFSCNQSTNNTINGKDVNLESTKLKEIREKIDLKTKIIYDSIDNKTKRYNSLVGDNKDITFTVRERTDEVVNFIQNLQIEIVATVEGQSSPAINGLEINTSKITKLNNSKIPSEILVGKNNNGKALDLKAILQEYKKYLVQVVREDSLFTNSIDTLLNTDDQKKIIPGKNIEENVTWERHVFLSQPLGSVILILTQIQNDVKNAESEALLLMLNKMDEKIKLNE